MFTPVPRQPILIDGFTKKQLDQAMARFFQEQPLVLEFVVRLSGHRDRIHELVVHLSRLGFSAAMLPTVLSNAVRVAGLCKS